MPCELKSERLLLRPPQPGDAAAIAAQIGDWDVAKNLSRVPFPYHERDAQSWILRSQESRARGAGYNFSVLRKWDGALIGVCGIDMREKGLFELGYWYGKRHWGHGYATEAGRRLLSFAFRDLKTDRILAGWFADNPASGNVLAKLGFVPAGTERRDSLSRGNTVICNMVSLSLMDFLSRKKDAVCH